MSESSKKIIYILIGKESKPLADCKEYEGSFADSCVKFLKQITKDSSVNVKTQTDYQLFYINENSITYLIMASNDYPKDTANGCLESIKKEFQSTYPGRDFDSEREFGLNEEFSPKLKMKLDYYNTHPDCPDEIVQKLHDEIINMKNEVVLSLNLMSERGDKMGEVEEKAGNLVQDSLEHKVKAKNVRKSECKRKVILSVGIVLVLLIIAYFITCIVCGNMKFQCSSQ